MPMVFHRFKHFVLVAANLAGFAATALLAVGVASAAPAIGPPGQSQGVGVEQLGELYIALLQSDLYGIEAAETAPPDLRALITGRADRRSLMRDPR